MYDITNKKVYYKTSERPAQKNFSISKFNFTCSTEPLIYNISGSDAGDLNKKFTSFSSGQNRTILKTAFKETGGAININEQLQNAVADFVETVRCGG